MAGEGAAYTATVAGAASNTCTKKISNYKLVCVTAHTNLTGGRSSRRQNAHENGV